MRAIAQDGYGSPDVLELRDAPTPLAGPDEVLIEVRAAALNPADWHFMRGQAYVVRLVGYGMGFGPRGPRVKIRGLDVSGRVEAVGRNVTRFRKGDEVFGQGNGAFAEYVTAPESALAPKPTNLTFEQAAAVPEAASTALQGLRDAGGIQQGQHVLINGASGGVGTYAVQLAVAYGAHVTGVCSTRNVDLVGSLGAHKVVDYTREDFTRVADHRPYDVILDLIGNRTLSECRRVLAPEGTLVLSNGDGSRWFGPLGSLIGALVVSPFVAQKLRPLAVRSNLENLTTLTTLIESGEVTPVIDRTYPLSETPAAMRYLEEGHARGKVVISVGPPIAQPPST
ncbi:NAD(P)-dependent alcohol dehydrogenase [Streptomyces sp. H27-C3]|uniref:NAD(P)-dependent alcohol dehydrogenase n=1 Tax=Streptomyces sp. H27-C3 TaxID=3046305 RepID=UPI0024B8B39B|nr:NAD(P)-dependent alcohol dehydrogenase [Streptomyces sp. H27-C3]MDJ0461103.1 NAD(P)-dependent alcohol dehydrogenase [Streptomyces sp. H27-C3]